MQISTFKPIKITDPTLSTEQNIFGSNLEEIWTGILHCKECFLQDKLNPIDCDFLRPEVASSWIRSRQAGIDPYNRDFGRKLSPQEFAKVLEENRLLMEVAIPLMEKHTEFVTWSNYVLWLYDKNCVTLYGVGNNFVSDRINDAEGHLLNESTFGTSAHFLAIKYKQPVQLIGPENYAVLFDKVICSSAPIMEENGNVIGAFVLSHWMGETPWKKELHNMWFHSLGWVCSLATATEKQLELLRSNKALIKTNAELQETNQKLEIMNATLKTYLSYINEGIVAVDRHGHILHCNSVGAHIFQLDTNLTQKHNILNFFAPDSPIRKYLNEGIKVECLEEKILISNTEKNYLINIDPVTNQKTKEKNIIILRFVSAEKADNLANKRLGMGATFTFEEIHGQSPELNKVKALAKRFAASPENILLTGESGTGKELFAHAIHNEGRPNGPFIAVNCAAMPRNLVESELFGYERGAFTGAVTSGKPGKIELANGGTLFLDEIEDMPYEIQAVLLRVLEDKKVMRLGGSRYKQVDFRLIAATNTDLYEMVKEKKFRSDLFFRLSVVKLDIPPLRQRQGDILYLANYFIAKYSAKIGIEPPPLDQAVIDVINAYDWPGNVRQLENAMIYAVNMAGNGVIQLKHLPQEILALAREEKIIFPKQAESNQLSGLVSLKEYEMAAIQNALTKTGHNIPAAARLLKISKATLYRKLREYNIEF